MGTKRCVIVHRPSAHGVEMGTNSDMCYCVVIYRLLTHISGYRNMCYCAVIPKRVLLCIHIDGWLAFNVVTVN